MKHLSILVPDEQTNMSTVACIVGAYQIFSEANKYLARKNEKEIFKIELVGATKNDFLTNDLLSIKHQVAIHEIDKTSLIIIPASLIRSYETASKNNKLLIDWVAKQYKQGAAIASMCAGSFMLASTGILAGKTCSTHWALSENFRELYPDINLQTDLLIKKHSDKEILMAQIFLEENYKSKISIEKLSSDFSIGRRNFDRRFIKATGLTPLDYLQRVKMEAAKKMFETTRKTVSEIMYEVGYNDAKAFRDVFSRITGLSPLAYKSKYNKDSRMAMA